MFVNLTRATTGDQPIENATIVGEEMERWLRGIEGYQGFLMLSKPGESIGLTFWESRDVAEHNFTTRMQFIERMLSVAGVQIEAIVGYELTYASLPALTPGSP